MSKLSIKSVVAIAIIALVVSIVAGILVYNRGLNDNNPTPSPAPTLTPTQTPTNIPIAVSGQASSAALSEPEITSIQKIEFTDVQTGSVTSFNFPFAEQSNNPFGNYTVTLENGHTYNVTISYYRGLTVGNMQPTSDYFTTFTVNATAGQTAITEDFE